jgi:predicted ATP-dependent Lon-type protease
MRLRVEIFVGLGIALVATITTGLEAVHFFDLIEQHIPEWSKPMINPEHNLILFGVGWILIAAAWAEYRHATRKHNSEDSSPPPPS